MYKSDVHHLRNITAFREENKPKKAITVSLDVKPRVIKGIMIMPWKKFLDDLWACSLIS